MSNKYINLYNNLIKLTRNKKLYINLQRQDTFSERLIFLLLHFAFFLKKYKDELPKNEAQNIFDFVIRQIELSIREIGYGDVSVNKKMKEYVNLFYSIIDRIDSWELLNTELKTEILMNLLDIRQKQDFYVNYFDNYCIFLSKSSLNNFIKGLINLKF